MVPPGTTLTRNDGIATTPLGDRLALLNLAESTYYAMNPVAAAVWDALETPSTPEDLVRLVRDRFEVGAADVGADLNRLVSDLLRLKLICAHDA